MVKMRVRKKINERSQLLLKFYGQLCGRGIKSYGVIFILIRRQEEMLCSTHELSSVPFPSCKFEWKKFDGEFRNFQKKQTAIRWQTAGEENKSFAEKCWKKHMKFGNFGEKSPKMQNFYCIHLYFCTHAKCL